MNISYQEFNNNFEYNTKIIETKLKIKHAKSDNQISLGSTRGPQYK